MKRKFSKAYLSRIINGDIFLPQNQQPDDLIRLDCALAKKYPKYSRSTLQKFIKNSQVSVDHEIINRPSCLIPIDAALDLKIFVPENTPAPPIIYEDRYITVFDKPAGMLSMSKGAYNPEACVADYGLLVHRLDRLTSGVIITAKDNKTKAFLQKQFAERRCKKSYIAVVKGKPNVEHAMINIPIARNFKKPTTFLPDLKGREALTEYKVLASNSKYSLLELKPQTGRTHQLRVHLKYLGTPILGDPIYGCDEENYPRMFLHAASLEITIPSAPNNLRKTFTSPLPEIFKDIMK